jgi:divalent metal cation (Fe/Co/Zn/Cd) transporter
MSIDCDASTKRERNYRIGEKLGSRAAYGEETQYALCAMLAAAVLVGLAFNTLFGLWWLDRAVWRPSAWHALT